jgi:hypothetical protein
MWYRQVLSGTRKEFLASLGVSPEIADWVETQPADAANVYTSALRNNPLMTQQELQAMTVRQRSQEPPYTTWEMARAQDYPDPEFQNWVLVQLRKMRSGRGENGDYDYQPQGKLGIVVALREIYDWFRFSKQNAGLDAQGQSRFQIASYDWSQANELSGEWHEVMAGRGQGLMYGPAAENAVVYRYGGDHAGWTIQLVTTENDLNAEGNMMNHCVGGYCEDVNQGRSRIYSLRDERNQPKVTIELAGRDNAVRQIMANSNSEPADELKALVKEWLTTVDHPYYEGMGNDLPTDEYKFEDYDDMLHAVFGQDDAYGIRRDLGGADFVHDVYEPILSAFQRNRWSRRGNWYTRDMARSAPVIAQYALQADIQQLQRLVAEGKMLNNPFKGKLDDLEEHMWEQLAELSENISDNMSHYGVSDYGAPDEPDKPEEWEYDTPEELEEAMAEYEQKYKEYEEEYETWREEAEHKAEAEAWWEGTQYLPYGFAEDVKYEVQNARDSSKLYQELVKQASQQSVPQVS